MTAFILALLTLRPLGFRGQTNATAGWWAERPLWLVVSAAWLAVLVAVFGRFERRTPHRLGNRPVAGSGSR